MNKLKIILGIAAVFSSAAAYSADKCSTAPAAPKVDTTACKTIVMEGADTAVEYRKNFIENLKNGNDESLEFTMSNPLVGDCDLGSMDFPRMA